MHFIVSSNVEKADPVTRKLIRSHVMRGKKTKKPHQHTLAQKPLACPIKLQDVVETCAAAIPGRVGSDLSFVVFADEVEPSLLLKMIKVSPTVMTVIFPLMAAIGFQPDAKGSLYPLVYDAVTLHITAFAIDGFFTRVLRGQTNGLSPAAMMHQRKGLRLLRERLLGNDEEKKISDSTIGTVLKLAVTAHFDGELEASKQHMAGLRKMVDLRGGMKAFDGTKLAVEIMRCDLSIAILDDTKTVFFSQPSEPIAEYPKKLLVYSRMRKTSDFVNDNDLISRLSPDLAIGWQVMRNFCVLINLGTQTHRLVEPELIHQTMASVIYHLLRMEFAIESIDETARLGLVAFAYHVFLQWQDMKFGTSQFATRYKEQLRYIMSTDKMSSEFILWLLVTGSSTFFKAEDEVWLRKSLRDYVGKCNVRSWKDMEGKLKSIMWIGLLDEKHGKELYSLLEGNE
ncbi:hypothetical protein BKA64DRAFT_562825 [Cadophora sp. MPI-SDFR-AT-0126]|nr:hypothetical protein BKA64DRAFT_562825 [Leotiomycetes sp. MPI-SDFR-AT-0126]